MAGIARFTTGLPVTLLNNNDTSLLGTIPNGINNNGVDTPEWNGESLGINTNPRGGAAVFDASHFSLPALGTMGNARRRFFSGPGMENLDATLSRAISMSEGRSLEFRAEGIQRLQSRAVLRCGDGRGQRLQRNIWPSGERDAAAPDADCGKDRILTLDCASCKSDLLLSRSRIVRELRCKSDFCFCSCSSNGRYCGSRAKFANAAEDYRHLAPGRVHVRRGGHRALLHRDGGRGEAARS